MTMQIFVLFLSRVGWEGHLIQHFMRKSTYRDDRSACKSANSDESKFCFLFRRLRVFKFLILKVKTQIILHRSLKGTEYAAKGTIM